ncbi:nitroreductase family protein [Desulfosediminicola ganghwensis]|uniref:nitroreductase family protein n=1 Tax=Desulfosediminicola ganghwensis TaxID=2569540 RepID=UPI0010AD27C6|nr:nitroreductase family protein [Desulfosediminicola ganghwensis]
MKNPVNIDSVVINGEVCTGCALCVDVCPHRLLALKKGKAVFDNGQDQDCMECGHCAAICPLEAVSVEGVSAILDFQTFPEKLKVLKPEECDCSSLVQLMRSRRSCRKYTSQPVETALLEDLVKIGITAPSGTNSQSWDFVILPTRADVEALGNLTADFYRKLNSQAANPLYRLLAKFFANDALNRYYQNYYQSVAEALREWDEDGVDRLFHGATAAIVVTGRKDASCPAEDALLATQNILLAAHTMGLGSCLIGFAVEAVKRSTSARAALAMAGNEEIYSVIALGYPAVTFRQVAGRKEVQPRVLHLAGALVR